MENVNLFPLRGKWVREQSQGLYLQGYGAYAFEDTRLVPLWVPPLVPVEALPSSQQGPVACACEPPMHVPGMVPPTFPQVTHPCACNSGTHVPTSPVILCLQALYLCACEAGSFSKEK